MPIFKCDECECIENTALSNYWMREDGDKKLCSECDPEIKEWHGVFDKKPAKGYMIDQSGHLWSKKTIEENKLPQHYKIVGEV